jgi:hypothetical protein
MLKTKLPRILMAPWTGESEGRWIKEGFQGKKNSKHGGYESG